MQKESRNNPFFPAIKNKFLWNGGSLRTLLAVNGLMRNFFHQMDNHLKVFCFIFFLFIWVLVKVHLFFYQVSRLFLLRSSFFHLNGLFPLLRRANLSIFIVHISRLLCTGKLKKSLFLLRFITKIIQIFNFIDIIFMALSLALHLHFFRYV